MSLFSTNDKERKMLVVFDYITRYCPKALREITKVAVANNVRYNPGRAANDINWARDKSKDQLGSLFRHMLERRVDGKIFEPIDPAIAQVVGYDKVYVLAEAAWRALAALELDIEAWETAMEAQTPAPKPLTFKEEPYAGESPPEAVSFGDRAEWLRAHGVDI